MSWRTRLHTRTRLPDEGERGQLLIMAALSMILVLMFAALAIDVGLWVHTRTKLQADADAMALAGAQKLCADVDCNDDAVELATSYASLNAVSDNEVMSVVVGTSCDGTVSNNHDLITVRTGRTVPTFLAKLIGIVSADIDACATARKASIAGGTGIVPFGIEETCLGIGVFGQPYTLKYDSEPDSTSLNCEHNGGNFGLLAIDTSGAGSNCGSPPDTLEELKIKEAICFGANRFLCSKDATECVGVADDDNCGSWGHAADDESCNENGNKVGPVSEGIDYRIDNTDPACDTWEEVTYPDGGLRQECNPWINEDSRRVIMIPVVDGLWDGVSGTKKVDIVNFALFFLETFQESQCKKTGTSVNCDVSGRFITTSLSANYEGLDDLKPNSSLTVVTLTR